MLKYCEYFIYGWDSRFLVSNRVAEITENPVPAYYFGFDKESVEIPP